MPAELAQNKRAHLDYEFLEEFEGGLMLDGSEVKSVKAGHVQLKGSFLHLRRGELWLKNAHVTPYKPAGVLAPEAQRDRKVLIHKKELLRLTQKSEERGLTIIPISVYLRGSLIKLRFALARGKKKYEKRESLKKKELNREMRAMMKL